MNLQYFLTSIRLVFFEFFEVMYMDPLYLPFSSMPMRRTVTLIFALLET